MALNTTGGQIRVLNSKININTEELTDSEAAQISALSRNSQRKELFSTDLLMFAEGDLFVNNKPYTNKDLDLVSGVYNYAQAITHRLMTASGTMPGDDTFGVPWNSYLGVTYSNPSNILRALIAEITEELFKDSRTSEVVYVRPELVNPNTIQVECAVIPVGLNTNIDILLSVGV